MATTKEQIAALEVGKVFTVSDIEGAPALSKTVYMRTKAEFGEDAHDGITSLNTQGRAEITTLEQISDAVAYTVTVLN